MEITNILHRSSPQHSVRGSVYWHGFLMPYCGYFASRTLVNRTSRKQPLLGLERKLPLALYSPMLRPRTPTSRGPRYWISSWTLPNVTHTRPRRMSCGVVHLSLPFLATNIRCVLVWRAASLAAPYPIPTMVKKLAKS